MKFNVQVVNMPQSNTHIATNKILSSTFRKLTIAQVCYTLLTGFFNVWNGSTPIMNSLKWCKIEYKRKQMKRLIYAVMLLSCGGCIYSNLYSSSHLTEAIRKQHGLVRETHVTEPYFTKTCGSFFPSTTTKTKSQWSLSLKAIVILFTVLQTECLYWICSL